MSEVAEVLAQVEVDARRLTASIQAAEAQGVSGQALMPTLVSVFKEAGMFPDWLDLDQLAGLLG